MHDMILPVRRMPYARHPQHFIGFLAAAPDQVAVRDDVLRGKRAADLRGIDKVKEALPVFLVHILRTVFLKPLMKGEMNAFLIAGILRVHTVADRVVSVQIHMIYAAVI